MPSSRSPERARGYTLVELMVALLVLAVLAAGLALPLAAQLHARRLQQTRAMLAEAKEALLGFAAAHGRLPCPATAASRGLEAFAPGASAASGACADFHGGWLPAAALGLAPLDPEGFLRDGWEGERNRIRYAVHAGALGGVAHALTRTQGLQAAGLDAVGAASHYLFVCGDGSAASASGCGPAARQLTRRAAFVLVAPGPNAAARPVAGSDEARNADGDAVFVSREPSEGPGREFDDVVDWMAVHLLVNRLIVSGRLP